jgi:orotidine-5'-phosphate decarboxylase
MTPKTCGFADRLLAAVARAGSPACIGIDPVFEKLPSTVRPGTPIQQIGEFCRGLIEASAGAAPVVKFQSACFERYGGAGVALLTDLVFQAKKSGLLVIIDAKRGDIGFSNEHYAAAIAATGADAVTASGYLGRGVVEPILKAGVGVFVLVRTSNPDGDAVQSVRLADGRTVAEMMADQVAEFGRAWAGESGISDVGAVVGATKASEGAALRARMPRQVFLVPGFGAQGGTPADVRALLDDHGAGVLVTASRSVIYAFERDSRDWIAQVRAAAKGLSDDLRALAG